jgi:methylphosphotriester-DNA--protein-cysteine methyltransferase
MINGCRTTRIYCRENCPPGRRTLPANRVRFASDATSSRLAPF